MNIKKLEAIVKTAECKSVSLAAAELGLTQSAVSHLIADFEEELGFSVLVRSRRGAVLTPQGEKIFPYLTEICRQYAQMLQEAESINGVEEGTVRIGTFSSVAVHWLPGILKSFEKDYPKIEIRLLNGDYHDVEQWLRKAEIDVGFTTLPCTAPCRTELLFEDRLLAILPKDHRLAAGEVLPLKALEGEPFIGLLESSNQDARNAMAKAGMKLHVKYNTKDDYAVIAMVENGLGYSIMPELLLKGRTENVAVLELDPPSTRKIAVAVPDSSGISPPAAVFIEYVRNWLQNNA